MPEHVFPRRGLSSWERSQVVPNLLWKFVGNEQGESAIEYGLLAAGISVAIVAVVAALGADLDTTVTTASDDLN
jgi:pilus assembly protein Flp/PilA